MSLRSSEDERTEEQMGLMERGVGSAGMVALVISLAGCDGFFVKPGSSGSGSTTGGTTGSYAYVTNRVSSANSLGIYALSGGNLTTQARDLPMRWDTSLLRSQLRRRTHFCMWARRAARRFMAYNIGSSRTAFHFEQRSRGGCECERGGDGYFAGRTVAVCAGCEWHLDESSTRSTHRRGGCRRWRA